MAVVKVETLLPHVEPYVPGCPREDAISHIVEAAATFCSVTHIWREDLDASVVEVGEPLTEIDVPTGAVLEDMAWLTLEGRELDRVSDLHQAPSHFADQGHPVAFAVFAETSVRFYPTPDAAYSFAGVAVLKPALSASVLDKAMSETWGRTISYGAISQLLMIPDKPWSNPDRAVIFGDKFERGITNARIRDFRRVPLRVKMRSF